MGVETDVDVPAAPKIHFMIDELGNLPLTGGEGIPGLAEMIEKGMGPEMVFEFLDS